MTCALRGSAFGGVLPLLAWLVPGASLTPARCLPVLRVAAVGHFVFAWLLGSCLIPDLRIERIS